MKGGLDSYGNYEHYIDPSLKEAFVQNLQATVDWIYGEGEHATLKEYQERMAALTAIGNPVKARYRFRSEIGEWIDFFQKYKTEKLEKKLALPASEETKHLTDEQRQTIASKVQVVDEFFAGIDAELSEKGKE